MLIPTLLIAAALASFEPQKSSDHPDETKANASPRATEKPEIADGAAWKTLESPFLTNAVQLTFRDKFARAGEAYFSSDGEWIIFQAILVPDAGKEADPFYAMFVAQLVRDETTRGIQLRNCNQISPPHSANTCGWFDPVDMKRVIFGSTLARPTEEKKSGFQVGSRKYVWMFPSEMEIVSAVPFASLSLKPDSQGYSRAGQCLAFNEKTVFSRPNYDAECSYSKDGRFILYAHIEDQQDGERPDANIYIYDTKSGEQHPIVVAPGYDGGPFFSPDGKSICYRSDRKGDDLLQLFIADLKFDANGVPVGITQEYQLTGNEHVNWCPYWHPSGKFLVYATSEVSHQNYEVFAVEVDRAKLTALAAASTDPTKPIDASAARRARITHAPGADVLPAFSSDGKHIMWTSQRGPKLDSEERPSSQLWIADWTGNPFTLPKVGHESK
jgi:hypothetical protein